MKKVVITTLAGIALACCFAFTNASQEEKVTIMISHEVKDFATWKKGFDADEPNRAKAGFKFVSLYRSVEKPNVITGILEAPSAEAVQKFLSNPELKAAMEKSGVISAPEIKLLTKVQ